MKQVVNVGGIGGSEIPHVVYVARGARPVCVARICSAACAHTGKGLAGRTADQEIREACERRAANRTARIILSEADVFDFKPSAQRMLTARPGYLVTPEILIIFEGSAELILPAERKTVTAASNRKKRKD